MLKRFAIQCPKMVHARYVNAILIPLRTPIVHNLTAAQLSRFSHCSHYPDQYRALLRQPVMSSQLHLRRCTMLYELQARTFACCYLEGSSPWPHPGHKPAKERKLMGQKSQNTVCEIFRPAEQPLLLDTHLDNDFACWCQATHM